MELGYIVAVLFAVIWVGLKIAETVRRNKLKAEIERMKENAE